MDRVRAFERWRLRPDGEAIRTPSAYLVPVRTATNEAGMLKVARDPDEIGGIALMEWWAGDGAARVLARHGSTAVYERALDSERLIDWTQRSPSDDDAATRVICAVMARLHAPRASRPPPLSPLAGWFEDLRRMARRHGGLMADCMRVADGLLAAPRDVGPLHGDCHHANVLNFGGEDWRAIDPKNRFGERGFDLAQIVVNPDLPHAPDRARFARQVARVAATAGVSPDRLTRWCIARAGLSAAWFSEDGDEDGVQHDLAIVRTGLAVLAGEATH